MRFDIPLYPLQQISLISLVRYRSERKKGKVSEAVFSYEVSHLIYLMEQGKNIKYSADINYSSFTSIRKPLLPVQRKTDLIHYSFQQIINSLYFSLMKSVLRAFIYGAVFISLCTVALCMETSLLLRLPLNSFSFYLVVFSATLGQYNIHYYIKRDANPDSDRFFWSVQHRRIHLLLNVIGAIGLIIGVTHLKSKHFLALGIIAIITILYSFPLLPFKRKKRLKDFGLLKILTLSYVWTLITVWFPVINLTKITPDFMLVFMQRFIFMFALCLAFDIRDATSDRKNGIRTLPVSLGFRWSYIIINACLILFLVLSILHFRHTHQFMQLNAMIISALATYFMTEYAKTKNTDMIYLAGIDGMMMLQAILVMLGSVGI